MSQSSQARPQAREGHGARRVVLLALAAFTLLVLAVAVVALLGEDPWDAFVYEGFN